MADRDEMRVEGSTRLMRVQVAGGAARGCAALTGDQEYSRRFRPQPRTRRQHLLHGVQSAGVGLYEGAIGLVKEPLVGWQVALPAASG